MYTSRNFTSKAALKRALTAGDSIRTFQPGGMFPPTLDGTITLEGPHFPQPHRCYATPTGADATVAPGSVQ